MFTIPSGPLDIRFTEAGGGLPDCVSVREADGTKTLLLERGSARLEIGLADGRVLRPAPAAAMARRFERGGACHVEFPCIPWTDEKGGVAPGFCLSLHHEFYPDGTAFSNALFFVESSRPPEIVRLELVRSLACRPFDDVRWSLRGLPRTVDGRLIQAQIERFLPPGETRTCDPGTLALVSFNLTRRQGPSLYAEFFVEGANTLSDDPDDNASSVGWRAGDPVMRWTFQKRAHRPRILYQWRNQWGWVIRPAPARRRLPPLRMFHYIDKFQRYPSAEQVEAMADAGCDVLILHEQWRRDVQNGGIPYDPDRFRALIEDLHARHIRLAVYMRGNEESVVEYGGAWFDDYLTRNIDGLYMDYGSPMGLKSGPDETYNGGRVHFRRHYLNLRQLRERIGPEGVFYSHTGPSYSAVGMPFMDGYVSGEGERGLLVRGRAEHEYFSMAAVGPGTMWTAAFPEYASPVMTPFLAAAGQYPHVPLGVQIRSSSLVHPPEPGVDDGAFRTLWKLWSVFRNERDLAVVNDFNSRGVFAPDRETGHYLMVSADRRKALLILSNFSGRPRPVDPAVNWALCGFDPAGAECRLLGAGGETVCPAPPAAVALDAYGVAAVFWTAPGTDTETMLSEFRRPAHAVGPLGKAYLAAVERQRTLRGAPPAWPRVYLTLSILDRPTMPYEDSLFLDVYFNHLELGELRPDGTFRHVAWIGKSGVLPAPREEDLLFVGDRSPPVALHELLKPGRYRLAVRSWHGTAPFYSFVSADLSPTDRPDDPQAYRLEFFNELEPDRSRITWETDLARA